MTFYGVHFVSSSVLSLKSLSISNISTQHCKCKIIFSISYIWSLNFLSIQLIIFLWIEFLIFLPFLVVQVALKTLIVIHRLLREGDPTFREELLNFSQRGRILQLSNFKDDSSPIGQFYTRLSFIFSLLVVNTGSN